MQLRETVVLQMLHVAIGLLSLSNLNLQLQCIVVVRSFLRLIKLWKLAVC